MTLRAGSSVAAFTVVAVIAALLLGDAAIRGSWDVAARALGPGLLAVWVAWLLLVRPSIRVLPDRAIVTNVGRVTEVPWGRVVDIRRQLQLRFELDGDRDVEAWGSPFASKKAGEDDSALIALRAAWMSWSGDADAPVIRRPDTVALTVGAAALVAGALSITLGGGL